MEDHRHSLRSPPPEVEHVRCLRCLCDVRRHRHAIPSGRIRCRRALHNFLNFPVLFRGEWSMPHRGMALRNPLLGNSFARSAAPLDEIPEDHQH